MGFFYLVGSLICDNFPVVVPLLCQVRANATAWTKAEGRDRTPEQLFVRRMEQTMVIAGGVWVRLFCFWPNIWHRPLNQTNTRSDPLPPPPPSLPSSANPHLKHRQRVNLTLIAVPPTTSEGSHATRHTRYPTQVTPTRVSTVPK